MKNIFFILISTIILNSSCILLNQVNANPGHVKGSKAKAIITDEVLIFVLYDLSNASTYPADAALYQIRAVLNFMSAEFANIQDDKFYKLKDVNKCARDITDGSYYISSSNPLGLAPWAASIFICNLQPDKPIWDP